MAIDCLDPAPAWLTDLFPQAGEETLRLLAGAERAGILASDFHTLHDWLDQSGHHDRPAAFAVALVLMLALEEGSLGVELTMPRLTARLGEIAGAEAEIWARRIVEAVEGEQLANLIGRTGDDSRPILLWEGGGRRFLYFQKYLRCEQAFYQALQERLKALEAEPPAKLRRILDDVLKHRPLVVGNQSLQLDDDQKAALGLALGRNLTIISGGPGTGKTSLIVTLLRCLLRLGHAPDRIALAAPTGRAAQRMSDALQAHAATDAALAEVPASTLHQLLKYSPVRGEFRRHEENPIPADVIVVDEVSMVGIELMARLLRALPPDAKLILLGDKDQLPSVDAGAVLAHLMPDEPSYGLSKGWLDRLQALFGPLEAPQATEEIPLRDRVALLRTNHRSHEAIRTAAEAINLQDATLPERLSMIPWPAEPIPWADLETTGGCWLWEPVQDSPAELRQILDRWAQHLFSQKAKDALGQCRIGPEDVGSGQVPILDELFAHLERYRLLTLVREGPWGALGINAYLEQHLRPRLDPEARGMTFAGAPILVTRTDEARGLCNGDVGLTVRTSAGGRRVIFRRQGRFVSFAYEALPAHEFGFALTVHKSQGSEYGTVLLVLPPEAGRRLLTKELIYTAITRAKNLAIVCGRKETLRLAISRRIQREAGILTGWLESPGRGARQDSLQFLCTHPRVVQRYKS